MNKKALLGNLYYDLSKQDENFKLAYAWKNKEGDIIWSKHLTFFEAIENESFIEKCNNRSILKNELVLDIDLPTDEAKIKMIEITTKLKELKVPFKCYFTGSKGFHIHCFKRSWIYMNKLKREQEKSDIIEVLGCDKMKAKDYVMIAIEGVPHWKTGNKKELVLEWMA